MVKFTTLPDFLERHRSAILESWQRRVLAEIEESDLSRVELLDHVPQFIDEVVDCLRGKRPSTAETGSENAPEHGRQRLRVGFDVDEVVREYGILADVVLEAVEVEEGDLDPHEVRVFLGLLNEGAAEAVRAYVRRRDEESDRQAAQHRSFIAHELRTPLGSAVMALTVLRHAIPDAADNQAVGLISRSLSELREMVDQVLIEGRLRAGAEPEWAPLDVSELLHGAVEQVAWQARTRRIQLDVQAPDVLRAHGDRRLLHSAITNLVANGIKFSAPGSTVAVRAVRVGHQVAIEVSDGCGGFEPAPGVDVFEPFVRTTSDPGGFGLGLAIAKQAAEAHGGDITYRNEPPRGCVFTLMVPVGEPT